MSELKITKERVLEAAGKCSVAERTLKTLFPEAFQFKPGDVVVDTTDRVPVRFLVPDSAIVEILSTEYGALETGQSRIISLDDGLSYMRRTAHLRKVDVP